MQNVAKFRTNSSKYVHFFYLGPIRTNESQKALMYKSCPKWHFLGLFRCKQIFSQNVAKFRLIEGLFVPLPNTYEKWQICPLFVSRPNTYEWVSKSRKCTKVAVKDFVGSIWIQTNIFHFKSRPNYTGLQWNFSWGQRLRFLKNDPRLPYLMNLM